MNRLKPNIAARVAIADPGNLRTAINEARATEARTYYMKEFPQAMNNDAIKALTKQMEQLSFNYTNIVNVLAAQNGIPRTTNVSPKNTNATRNNIDKKPFDKSQIVCWRCEEKGHYSRECLSERSFKPKQRDANLIEVFTDDEGEEEVSEVYAEERSRPYTTDRKNARI